MTMSILNNPASLAAQRHIANTQRAQTGNISRMASGLRIAQASDDAAGLGISEKLRAQVRGLVQANRNANDGVSMIQVAEGAMNEQAGILTRLRELAVQSANGTLGADERTFIDAERTELVAELDRIAAVTEFNGTNMLGADAGVASMQVGIHATGDDTIDITFAATDSAALGVDVVDLSSVGNSQTALGLIDAAINTLSTNRATVGASQNRLVITQNNLSTAHENLTAAESRIRDVDVASETAAMTRNQILSQAGVAVLAQSNQLPSMALSLIGG